MPNDGMKEYLVERKGLPNLKITIPEAWKVTYGPVAVGQSKFMNQAMPLALRFYESDTKQRAIFTDVTGFRDLSIEVKEKFNGFKEGGIVEEWQDAAI